MYRFSKLFRIFSITQLDNLISFLKEIRSDKFHKTYKVVEIFPGKRVEDKITKETGFYCYHVLTEYGRGTHVIVIPIKKYSEELKESLINTYDDKW